MGLRDERLRARQVRGDARRVRPGPFARALELGGSIGVFSALLAPRYERLDTIDGAPSAVAAARARLAGHPGARAHDGAIPDDIPRGPFDLVVASEVLYYLDDQELDRTLSRLAEELRSRRPPGRRPLASHRAGPPADRRVRPRPPPRVRVAAPGRAAPLRVPPRRARAPVSTRLDLVVLGGGPAAFAAARGYRDAGGSGEVAIVADERRLPYNRPSLSKELLRGEMDERELPLADDEWLGSEDVRLLGGAAVAIDASERTVALAGGEVVGYDNCVLATGGEPTRLPVPGADDRTVHVFRSLDDLHHLKARLSGGGAGRRDRLGLHRL